MLKIWKGSTLFNLSGVVEQGFCNTILLPVYHLANFGT